MQSDFIPNSYQTPNAYLDKFMAFLTPEEWKVLSYFTRRIFGFGKRQDNIACSQIMDGIVAKSGERLDYGTGLGMQSVKSAIKSLIAFRLIVEVAKNDPHNNRGPLYSLQLDSGLVNEAAMIARFEASKMKQNRRMEKARLSNRGVPIQQTPHYPIDTPPPLSNRLHNNQGNTVKTQTIADDKHPRNTKAQTIPQTIMLTMVTAIAEVTRQDLNLNYAKLAKSAKTLISNGYTHEQIVSCFGSGGAWYRSDWRGKNGQAPSVSDINAKIKQFTGAAQTPQFNPVEEF
jgi:hypothetical protein